MGMKNLVIFGRIDDAHLRFISRELPEDRVKCLFYDPLRLIRADIELPTEPGNLPLLCLEHPADEGEVTDVSVQEVRTPDEIDMIWLRNKKIMQIINNETDQRLYFSAREHQRLIHSLVRAYECRHFNTIDATIRQSDKVVQLQMARAVGFRVPKTLVSSNKSSIAKFVGEHENVIVKPLATNFVPPPLDGSGEMVTLLTNMVTSEDLDRHDADSFAAAPAIYQRMIEKAYEVRLVAFGDECVAYRIDSQASEKGRLDWRRAQFEKIYHAMEATDEMRYLAAAYLKRAALAYGVFDLVVDRGGMLWFLECNSDGQWAWLELEGDRPVARMFARRILELLEGAEMPAATCMT
ncbi:MAG: hypothetical protein D6757_03865 [Alphaproteobacteria bacterium]|nr:MAG: hypothetical protein D6757_03865 [Alphaproteobacteria bacterium]